MASPIFPVRYREKGKATSTGRIYPPPSLRIALTTILRGLFRIRAPFTPTNARDRNPITGWAMTEKEDARARERQEIAARVARFKATQQKFKNERENYYATTLANAWPGYQRPPTRS
jgi:hypothetical protein